MSFPLPNILLAGKKLTEIVLSVTNAGGINTTDWVDSNEDGTADNWTNLNESKNQASIVTGNGFTGNAQRNENLSASVSSYIRSDPFPVENGAVYEISFKYRASDSIAVLLILDTSFNIIKTVNMGLNIGNAILKTDTFTATDSQLIFQFYPGLTGAIGDYVEIDELELKTSLQPQSFGASMIPGIDINNDYVPTGNEEMR